MTALRTSSGSFAIRRGFASSARDPKNTAAAPHRKKPPLSQFLADCFISSTNIHLQDSTRAIGDRASNIVRQFCYKEGICIQRARSKKHSDLHPARAIQKTQQISTRENKAAHLGQKTLDRDIGTRRQQCQEYCVVRLQSWQADQLS